MNILLLPLLHICSEPPFPFFCSDLFPRTSCFTENGIFPETHTVPRPPGRTHSCVSGMERPVPGVSFVEVCSRAVAAFREHDYFRNHAVSWSSGTTRSRVTAATAFRVSGKKRLFPGRLQRLLPDLLLSGSKILLGEHTVSRVSAPIAARLFFRTRWWNMLFPGAL